MSSEVEDIRTGEQTEDELARSLYRLNTLYELNQEISTLRNVREVLEASLLNIIGVFGLKQGLIIICKNDEPNPHEFVYRGMRRDAAMRWLGPLEPHLKAPYIREICVAQNANDSPFAQVMKDYFFRVWLPLEVDEQTWGGIALGEKLSEMDFTADDLELLSTIAINVQNVLSNVLLIEALNQSVIKETRIRNIFQRHAPESVINEVLNPSNEELLLSESQAVRQMFEQMLAQLEEQHALEQDLNWAHSVQESLLPDKPPEIPGIEITARSIPARGVCGDFYDFIELSPYEVAFSLADIAGKGMSAAMIAIMLQSATRLCVGNYYPIPAVLSILNRFTFSHTESMRYATMFYGQMNAQEGIFTYSNAGHPPAIICRNGKVQLLDVGGPFVGMFEYCSYEQETIELQPKDVLVIYSDGVTDAGITLDSEDPEDAFGQERLEAVVVANAALPANALLDAISDEVTRYASGSKQFDDITMIVMKVE
ncbi:SpoIIE family protein phosphatase [bacterium]|nr:SpoIIE family protein phosphatase [bacterium]